MCILEAVTLDMPWAETEDDFVEMIYRDQLPSRRASFTDAQWALIEKMCTFEPTERPSIDYIVAQLKQFAVCSRRK